MKQSTKEARPLKKIINNSNLYLCSQISQNYQDPFLGTFSAINLTLSDPSIFIDYNWRVYKDPLLQKPLLNNKGKLSYRKLRTTNNNKTPMTEFKKKANWSSLKKTMPCYTNPRIKYKLRRTHNTFYQHPHYHNQQNYSENTNYGSQRSAKT